ncbi:MAG: D-alanyl-D-alanine carboxypeptidase family protein [Chloroherpetonaceae bacterium]|nr:D-alanyl-D-alanine carboxypeptidase [Chthonomonadaceae bacterium]MDW8209433.1 D-alanyl-D-alanine carboxypeptidase family protein [Chloroherpetonaceae bacterium]
MRIKECVNCIQRVLLPMAVIGLYTDMARAQAGPLPPPPDIHARAAIVMEARTGQVLFARNADLKLPPASTTKILTGYLFARDIRPEERVKTPMEATRVPGSALGMPPGSVFTARDLLYAALLKSANDACIAMARHAAGSVPGFVDRMNAEAQALGLTRTRFANPHGLPAREHYSTARDLAHLTRHALRLPAFARAVRTRVYVIPASGRRPAIVLRNRNTLLWTVPGMVGVKTGQSREAGLCLVGAVQRGQRLLITVVLNSPRWKEDTVALVQYGFARSPLAPPAGEARPSVHRDSSLAAGTDPRTNLPARMPHPGQDMWQGRRSRWQPEQRSDADRHASVVRGVRNRDPGTSLRTAPDMLPFRRSAPRPELQWARVRPGWNGLWWLLIVLAALLVARRIYRGLAPMKPVALWPFARRRRQEQASASSGPIVSTLSPPPVPEFRFDPPQLARFSGPEWLDTLLETSTRLLEPAVRRRARALISANPKLDLEKVLQMLGSARPRNRLVAAELLLDVAPRRAEEALVALIEEEKTPGEIRTEAIDLLSGSSGDRYEPFFLRMMLRDGTPAFACALARLPRLDSTTTGALRHVIATSPGGDAELRTHLLKAQAACVLAAHQAVAPGEALAVLEKLPAHHRDPVLTGVLRGVATPWTVERMVDLALRGGSAYLALQNLLECPPEQVRQVVDALPEPDSVMRTRLIPLRWLLLGQGDYEQVRRLAEAGDDLANSALNLSRLHGWYLCRPRDVSPHALLAAAMLLSVRLGFTEHTPEQVAAVFRTVGEGTGEVLSLPEELVPLRQACACPEVHDAVQAALHTEMGLDNLLFALAGAPRDEAFLQEIAFWSDKVSGTTRGMLAQALAQSDHTSALEAMEAREMDPHAPVRGIALRAARDRCQQQACPNVSTTQEGVEPVMTLDQAA